MKPQVPQDLYAVKEREKGLAYWVSLASLGLLVVAGVFLSVTDPTQGLGLFGQLLTGVALLGISYLNFRMASRRMGWLYLILGVITLVVLAYDSLRL